MVISSRKHPDTELDQEGLRHGSAPAEFSCEKLLLPGVILAVMAIFLPVLGFEFLSYDDGIHVYGNHYLQAPGLHSFRHFWGGAHQNLYLPMTYSLWVILAWLSGVLADGGPLSPAVFHGANLLVHLANCWLVFMILRFLLKGENLGAAVGALFFGLHPIQVESVAWVSAMRDLFSTFWALFALYQYLLFIRADGRRRHYVLAISAYLLALLAKPGAAALPLAAALIAVLLLDRPWRQVLRELFPWLGLAATIVLVTSLAQPGQAGDFQIGWWERLLVAGDALTFYCGKLLWPLNLGVDYGRSPRMVLNHDWVFVTGLLPYLLGGMLFWKGSRSWLTGVGIFVAGLLPVLGFVQFDFQQVSTVADRYLYLALLGPALLVGMLAGRYRNLPVKLLLALLVSLLAVKTLGQLPYWRDSKSCYRQALEVNASSWFASNNLGVLLLMDNRNAEAASYFRRALTLRPDFVEAHNNLGLVLMAEEKFREAFYSFRQAIELSPAYAEPYGNLAALYRKLDRKNDALEFYRKALQLEPFAAKTHYNLGTVYLETGREQEALAAFRKAIEVDPEFGPAYDQLVSLLRQLGQQEEAARYRSEAGAKGFSLIEIED